MGSLKKLFSKCCNSRKQKAIDVEREPLLITKDSKHEVQDAKDDRHPQPDEKKLESRTSRMRSILVLLPYLWPFDDKTLQFRALLVGVCLFASNALNVVVPASLGRMMDTLNRYNNSQLGEPTPNIYLPVAVYSILAFVSGSSIVGWLRSWLWLPLDQHTYSALSTAAHKHLMNLSSDFHESKNTSELIQTISRGRSVTGLLDTILFRALPTSIDLVIAIVYLIYNFGPGMGLILVFEAGAFFLTTTRLLAWSSKIMRKYASENSKEWDVGQSSLDAWNTASLFSQIPYEEDRYKQAVGEHMKSKKSFDFSSKAMSAIQGAILSLGLFAALFLGVYQFSQGSKTIGNITTLFVYWGNLQRPLVFFAQMHESISYNFINSERLLELFNTKPSITDSPNAVPLKLVSGKVEFDRVSFSYDERKPTLKDVSFVITPGQTIALVGQTGGGKSTILKLLDRFYDVKGGGIMIDGQDLRDVTLNSLRSKIGFVPQDPILFNDTIMSNLRYARLTATDEEVHEACKAAAVHDKIMTFPNQYNTMVGDHGVKLSGGEKQRVAIARAMLKKAEIVLLDEATSAVDTTTEGLIKKGLDRLCRGRTTIIVAHRLSTIMRADKILVIMNGEIVEQGSHAELLRTKGQYHKLWSAQVHGVLDGERFSFPDDVDPRKETQDLLG